MAIRCSQCGKAGKRIRVKPRSKAMGVSATTEDLVLLQKIRAKQRKRGLRVRRNKSGRFVTGGA